MRVDEFDFHLPEELIALRPASPRDAARLLVVEPLAAAPLTDRTMGDLPALLQPGDTLVFNDTKVIPAELKGVRNRDGVAAQVSVTLIERIDDRRWQALARPAKRLKPGDRITFGEGGNVCLLGSLVATVEGRGEEGEIRLAFELGGPALDEAIRSQGAMPLPPYIASRRAPDERDRSDYQTLFAREEGAVAAPTAGLHFTESLMQALDACGVSRHFVTLHVGPGTFLPVRSDDTADHVMHQEHGSISAETAKALNAVKARGGGIVAVGTTSLRLLESATGEDGTLQPFSAETSLFITPGYRFRFVDRLLTNFHLPRSTLFMLVASFAGLDLMQRAYAHAVAECYRFYSYGDACLLSPESQVAQSVPSPHRGEVEVVPVADKFAFKLKARDGAARTGAITTPRGIVRTPAFMPVGTGATVKAMFPEDVQASGTDIILANTYHLMLRPGAERIARLGGLHKFMHWDGPILTDSGGYQVMSLAKLRKIDEQGVTFQSHIDGATVALSPERAVEVQCLLGSDIQMVLDECTPFPATRDEARASLELSLRWAKRCKDAFATMARPGQALFGIVQGSVYSDLRETCARALIEIGFDGYAVGGLAVGEGQGAMLEMVEATAAVLPVDRPRYLMGVGTPEDLLASIARGIDMFDCVLPTRSGRHCQAFTWGGRLNLRNARYAEDTSPLDPESACPAARYERAYLHHLVRSGEMLGAMLLSYANVQFYQELMGRARETIAQGCFASFAAEMKRRYTAARDEDED